MKCMLMNRNTEVLEAEYNENASGFTKIYRILNIEYAPYILLDYYKNDQDITMYLTDWFRKRAIPKWRDSLEGLLAKLNVETEVELLRKSFGLSLADQYWIKPSDLNINHDDINFFTHDFVFAEYTEATFDMKGFNNNINLVSPNNALGGTLRKSWVIEQGRRVLLKSGSTRLDYLEPFFEVLASMISSRLGFDCVPCEIGVINGKVVSKCPCFINLNTEFIPAQYIMNSIPKGYCYSNYENYIQELEKHGIIDARIKCENMILLNYLMMNEDCHLNNFGVIRDVNTLSWLNVAPLFDNGNSLHSKFEEGVFFYSTISFDEMLSCIEDLTRFDISSLNGISKEFMNLLKVYQNITKISDEEILELGCKIDTRINKLAMRIEELAILKKLSKEKSTR